MTRRIRSIDLFAGAGGLTLGFELANAEQDSVRYEPVLAVEHDAAAALTYKTNFGVSVFDGDIEAVDPTTYPEAELILGGPPCQGFSPLGRDRDDRSRRVLNSLWEHFLAAVIKVEPLAFVIENVPEFQKSAEFAELRMRMASHPLLKEYGHRYGLLNAVEYGVPQRRRRGIFVAIRGRGEVPWPPPPTHGEPSLLAGPHRTVREAIGDLPPFPTTDTPVMRNGKQDLHIRRNPRGTSLERYRAVPEGGNRFDLQRSRPDLTPPCWLNKPTGTTDVMGRLWWTAPPTRSEPSSTSRRRAATSTRSSTGRSRTGRRPASRRFPTTSSSRAPRSRSPARSATPSRLSSPRQLRYTLRVYCDDIGLSHSCQPRRESSQCVRSCPIRRISIGRAIRLLAPLSFAYTRPFGCFDRIG